MEQTTVHLHTRHEVGSVDPRIFGGFLEHMGRAVYEGVWDPVSPLSDEQGYRTDVLEALRGLRFTVMRYPGGNFASGYHWADGVGPDRPTVRELAWRSTEPNTFGTHEFLELCERMGWTPMLTVNLGTGTPEEARDWVEYTNAPAGTRHADLPFDEWNVWYRTQRREHMDGGWRQAPELIEEVYDLADALVVAGFLHVFLRHADVVKVANLAQIVNVIAPVLTKPDGLLVQSIYHPFAMVSARRDGVSLRPVVRGPSCETTSYGPVPYVDASAVLGADRLHLFLTNRSPDRAAPVAVEVTGPSGEVSEVMGAEILTGPGPDASNTWEAPDTVAAPRFEELKAAGTQVACELPPLSFVAATVRLDR